MKYPGTPARKIEEARKQIRTGWITDADSLNKHLGSDVGQVADRRLRILIAQLREMMHNGHCECRWADTSVMLADCLTKLDSERQYLLDAMATGKWTPMETPESMATKAKLREQRHARKQRAKSAEKSKPR